jgi:hypothetical protein
LILKPVRSSASKLLYRKFNTSSVSCQAGEKKNLKKIMYLEKVLPQKVERHLVAHQEEEGDLGSLRVVGLGRCGEGDGAGGRLLQLRH